MNHTKNIGKYRTRWENTDNAPRNEDLKSANQWTIWAVANKLL